jgi:poly-beta-1,6-N-acetyl-D-glucosamine synthase
MTGGKRLLIISPVRNETAHIELVVESVARQTRPPDLWLVVDDGSEDGTRARLELLASEIPFMRLLSTPLGFTRDSGDRHLVAAAPRAFNWALATTEWRGFTHIGKLDGDIELPADYFERLLAEFDRNPSLGIGGGTLVEHDGRDWQTMKVAPHHVRGALKLYCRDCFEAIGGVQERLGWDGVDETYARMRGYETRSFDQLVARHHRRLGTADGAVRGKVRRGATDYVLGFHLPWAVAKSLKFAVGEPGPVAGAAYLCGYLQAAVTFVPRVEDPLYRSFVTRDQRRRLAQTLRAAGR